MPREAPDAAAAERKVLAARARELAAPVSRAEDTAGRPFLVLRLGGNRYALAAGSVREVFRLAGLTPLPGAEPPVAGLTLWRGRLLTLLDARRALGLSIDALNDLGRVVVLGEGRGAVGLLVDAVEGVEDVPVGALRPPPEGGRLVEGLTRAGLVVLDAAAVARLNE